MNTTDGAELILESWLSLTTNRARTGLAMLGVIIGIGSVIALMSLGQASQQSITNRIESLGTNLLTVRSGAQNTGGVRSAAGSTSNLTKADIAALSNKSQAPSISAISPEVSKNAQFMYGRQNMNARLTGVTPAYLSVNNATLQSGNFITDRQQQSYSKVAVLGSGVATELFGVDSNPIGKQVRIDGQAFLVIGVMASKGGNSFTSNDDVVYIPLATAEKTLFGTTTYATISIAAISQAAMVAAKEEITQVLLKEHKIADPANADFQIMSQEDLLGTATQVTGTFTTLLSGIAAISLVVGGIGIMNIMLVTVTERTREIGLRKALGAKQATIIGQFLLEAVMITVIGGMIGVVMGVVVSAILSHVMQLPFVLSLPSIGLAVGVSALIGVVFGWYPANRAAQLQPIEALRYE